MPETVAFTGTRAIGQRDLMRLVDLVEALPPKTAIVTGACIGVDAVVARLAHGRRYRVHTMVPADRSRVDPYWRKHCDTFEEMPPGTDYRARIERLVQLADRVIALPEYPEDHPWSRESGTWMTVRIAREAGKPVEVWVVRGQGRSVIGPGRHPRDGA